ncbi:hypothetical protein ABZS58_43430, partial [Dactylosporangium sp. NPDC005555]
LRLQRPGQPTLQPQLTRHVAGGRTATGGIFNGNGHDYVTAADRYGLIVVLSEATRSGNYFDLSTSAALRRNGGSDSTGIMSMVAYTRANHPIDASQQRQRLTSTVRGRAGSVV